MLQNMFRKFIFITLCAQSAIFYSTFTLHSAELSAQTFHIYLFAVFRI